MNFSRRTDWHLAPNRFSVALEQHRRSGRKLLDLTASNPTACDFTYDPLSILKSFLDTRLMQYHPDPRGLLSARKAVADYYREVAPDLTCLENRLLLTTSTSEAYSFVFRLLCDPGDQVLIPTPSYPLFEYLAGLQDVALAPYSLVYHDGWQIDFHSLERALTPRTRAVLLVHPNNPTGSYVKQREREQLNALAARDGLALIVDEVFLDYAQPGSECLRRSFVGNCEALTFTLSGISKTSGLPQMKLAWLAVSGPDELAQAALARLEVVADTYLSMTAPIQLAAPTLLNQRRTIQPQMNSRIRANLQELDTQLSHDRHCSRLKVEGGWYAILRVPLTRTDEELALALLDKYDVLVQPGYFYDFESDGYMVLSLITPEEEFREGVRRVLGLVRSNL